MASLSIRQEIHLIMKDEEPQVTLRRPTSGVASSSEVDSSFQRAPRPNSQPPGSSDSGQLRRSVREIRRSFEAGATDTAEASSFSKPLATIRRSFHFDRQPPSWETSDPHGRRNSSNGGSPITSPVRETVKNSRGKEGSGSKIPVRGGEERIPEEDKGRGDAGSEEERENGPADAAIERSTDEPTLSDKRQVHFAPGLSNSCAVDEIVVVQTEFYRIERKEEIQEVGVIRENQVTREKFDHVLPIVVDRDSQNGCANQVGSPIRSDDRKDSSQSPETAVNDAVSEKRNEDSVRLSDQGRETTRSMLNSNGVFGSPLGGSNALRDSRSSSPSSQKLSVTEAAESLEKSKSQIDRLQANLQTTLSSETVSSLHAKLSTNKSTVPMTTKVVPLPKSTSLPTKILSCLNGQEERDSQDKKKVAETLGNLEQRESKDSSTVKVKDPDRSVKVDRNPQEVRASAESSANGEKEKPTVDDVSSAADPKNSLRAQFFKTDVKQDAEQTEMKREKEGHQKSSATVKPIPVQQVLPVRSPVSSPTSQKILPTAAKSQTSKDLSFSVTSAVSSSQDGLLVVSSVTSTVVHPIKVNQESPAKKTGTITNGEKKAGQVSWPEEEFCSVENSKTSYRLVETTTVVNPKPKKDAQESYHIKPTTPRVVGVERKKVVDVPDKESYQGIPIKKHNSSGEKEKKNTSIPKLVERGAKSNSRETKEESRRELSPKESSTEKSGSHAPADDSNPEINEEYRAFLLCARREELLANDIDITDKIPDDAINHTNTAVNEQKSLDTPKEGERKKNGEGGQKEVPGAASKEKEADPRNGKPSGAGTSQDSDRPPGEDSKETDIKEDEKQNELKESPKAENKGGSKKMGFMMTVLGGLKDSSKKKKTVPKEVPPKPRREIKKRRGRVGPPLSEEEILAMELEAERRRKKREEEEKLFQEKKAEEKKQPEAQVKQQRGRTPEKVKEEETENKSLEKGSNKVDDDDDEERSAVRRDAYAELLKRLSKTEQKKEGDSGGGDVVEEERSEREEKTEEDTDGSDTAVEEEEEEYEEYEGVELRRSRRRELREGEMLPRGKPPIAPVPAVRTTSLTSRSISRTPTSPTIREGEEITSPTRPTAVAPTSSPVAENVTRSRAAAEETGARRRTVMETAFVGGDEESTQGNNYERQSATARLLRTPSPQISPGPSRIPHTSMVLEERLKRRSASLERDARRATSLSPPPVTSPVGRSRGGSNSNYVGGDFVDGESQSPEGSFYHTDRHRPLHQDLDPPTPPQKKPAKTFLQRILRQGPPPPPLPLEKKQIRSPRVPALRPRVIYDEVELRHPQRAQAVDPKTASLPVGALPPRGHSVDYRLRSLSPPTTPSEYKEMQQYFQRSSLQPINHYGNQRHSLSPPPALTDHRAVGAVRPQPLSYGNLPGVSGKVQQDPRSRSLSPQDQEKSRNATLPNQMNVFVRGSPARTTIATGEGLNQRKGMTAVRAGSASTLPTPIFKRGGMLASSEDSVCSAPAAPKKVSFSSSTPTKAEREHMRMLQLREWQQRAMVQYTGTQYADDDVFTEAPNKPLPPTPGGEEAEAMERRWLKAGGAAGGARRQLELSPTGVSESESGSEAGEVRRIMRRRFEGKDDEWGADGKSRGLPGTDQPGGIPGSRGAVVGSLGGGSGDELEVRRGGGGRPRRDEPRRHTLSHGSSVGGDEVHHHHHHHHHHRGGVPQAGTSLARSMDLENNRMADSGDAFLARMRRKVPLTSTPTTPRASPQLQYIRHQQRPPHPPTNMSLPGYGKTPLPRGSSGGSGSYYPPGMPGGGGGGHGTLDPRSVGHGGMMMGGGGMMYEEDDPGIMSEVETASTGFRRGGKQRSSLPVVRTPSKTLERPLGLVFLQYRNETKRALLPNEITSIDTVKALFVRSFPKQLSMEYLDSPLVKIYIHDSSKDMFYELEDLRSHLRDIRDRSVLRLFESDVNGGPGGGVMPGGMVGVPVPGPSPAPVPLWDQDQSYFSEPEFDSEYHHQHIHKTKGSKGGSGAPSPYYMTHSYPPGAQPGQPGVVVPPGGGGGGPVGGPSSSATLPRGPLLRAYSPATERIKPMPPTDRMHGESGYMSSPERGRPYPPYPSPSPAVPPSVGPPTAGGPPGVAPPYEDPYYGQYGATRSGSITPVIDEEARIRVEHMERQLANLTGLVQKALTQGRPPPGGSGPIPGGVVPPGQPGAPDGAPPGSYLQVPASRDAYRNADEYDKHSSSSSASLPDKSVSFEKSVSFSDEPPDMSSPKQHSPQHAADTKPPKPAIKSSTLPRTSSQERDHRHKPAPPPKPVSLSPGQYEGRHIYRDLHLTPEMYNQLRVLQRKAKDLRQEVRNLRRMSQAQAHSVRETIRDTFIKIRAMLLTGGETWLHQQQIVDSDRVRVNREEELYKQEMLRLEKDLTELESTVEELRGNVINRKTRVNMSDVENMALILSKSSKTVADLKVRFPSLQDGMKSILSSEMEKVVREEKFLKEEPERLESALRRCKKLTGTLVTLKRLASVQEQRLPAGNSSIDARLSPTLNDSPTVTIGSERGGSVSSSLGSPVSGSPGPNSKPATFPTGGVVAAKQGGGGGGNQGGGAGQRPESALDALLDELQTFSRPPSRSGSRKGSMDGGGAAVAPGNPAAAAGGGALQNSGQGTLRRLHSYPSSDSVGSPVKTAPATVQRLQVAHDGTPVSSEGGGSTGDMLPCGATAAGGKLSPKPPVPERSSDLLARRVPPPPPPRTSSRSPLVSPTSPPNHPQQHRPQPPLPSQSSTSSSASSHSSSSAASSSSSSSGPPPATLPRCVPRRSTTPTRNALREPPGNPAAAAAAAAAEEEEAFAIEEDERKRRAARREHLSSNSSSSESVNSQEGLQQRKGSGGSGSGSGSSKARQEALEQRHRELLRKQRQLQEQYARLQQLQRGGAAAPGCPGYAGPQVGDLKKTGSESNLLARMGHLGLSAAPATSGSLTHLAPPSANLMVSEGTNPALRETSSMTMEATPSTATAPTTPTSGKIYETDIL